MAFTTGKIVSAYSGERYLIDGKSDLRKIQPLILAESHQQYIGLGPDIAPAWEMGKKLIK